MSDESHMHTEHDDAEDLSESEGDIVADEDMEAGELALKKLREKLKKTVEEKQKYLEELQRAKADFVNLRKRDEEEKKGLIKFANQALAEELIPVLESFEMAKSNKEAWEKVDANWRKGVEYIHGQLIKILQNHNVQEIDPIGMAFDPARDEAVSYEPVEDENLNQSVIEVVQKGYSLSGKTLKAPRVKVGEYKKNSSQ